MVYQILLKIRTSPSFQIIQTIAVIARAIMIMIKGIISKTFNPAGMPYTTSKGLLKIIAIPT